jgi:hypothetical protein
MTKRKEAYRLYVEEGMPARAIAQALGVPVNTVYTWISRERKARERTPEPERTPGDPSRASPKTTRVLLKCWYGSYPPGQVVDVPNEDLAKMPMGFYVPLADAELDPDLMDLAVRAFQAAEEVSKAYYAGPWPVGWDPAGDVMASCKVKATVFASGPYRGVGIQEGTLPLGLDWPVGGVVGGIGNGIRVTVPAHTVTEGHVTGTRPYEERVYGLNLTKGPRDLLLDLKAWGVKDWKPAAAFFERVLVKAEQAKSMIAEARERARRAMP